ncbi:hypothetical protein [Mesorhizobium ventifaucium]|nr:hypothetical protein [Mesorhizobium ventifaucium]
MPSNRIPCFDRAHSPTFNMMRRLSTGLGIREGAVTNAATAFFCEPDHRRTSVDVFGRTPAPNVPEANYHESNGERVCDPVGHPTLRETWRMMRWLRPWASMIVAALWVMSIYAAQHWLQSDPPFVFYMLPTRACELLAGGLIAPPVAKAMKPNQTIAELLATAGLAHIIASLFLIDQDTPFPGPSSLHWSGADHRRRLSPRNNGLKSAVDQACRLHRPDILLALPLALAVAGLCWHLSKSRIARL